MVLVWETLKADVCAKSDADKRRKKVVMDGRYMHAK